MVFFYSEKKLCGTLNSKSHFINYCIVMVTPRPLFNSLHEIWAILFSFFFFVYELSNCQIINYVILSTAHDMLMSFQNIVRFTHANICIYSPLSHSQYWRLFDRLHIFVMCYLLPKSDLIQNPRLDRRDASSGSWKHIAHQFFIVIFFSSSRKKDFHITM